METHELTHIIGEHPFFADFPQSYRDLIAGCAKTMKFDADELLMREGEEANHFFLIRRGHVAVQIYAASHGTVTVETLGPDSVLGWSWLIPPYRYEFDARATELTRVIAFDGKCLRGKCEADPAMGFDLLRRFTTVIVRRLHATRTRLLDIYNIQR